MQAPHWIQRIEPAGIVVICLLLSNLKQFLGQTCSQKPIPLHFSLSRTTLKDLSWCKLLLYKGVLPIKSMLKMRIIIREIKLQWRVNPQEKSPKDSWYKPRISMKIAHKINWNPPFSKSKKIKLVLFPLELNRCW